MPSPESGRPQRRLVPCDDALVAYSQIPDAGAPWPGAGKRRWLLERNSV
jgi:hypothetical protein